MMVPSTVFDCDKILWNRSLIHSQWTYERKTGMGRMTTNLCNDFAPSSRGESVIAIGFGNLRARFCGVRPRKQSE